MNTRVTVRPAPEVRYVVESAGIRLIDTGTGAEHTLGYPEAAVWDMAARGYDSGRIATCLEQIAWVTPTHAAEIVRDTFAMLHERGFVCQGAD
jgi:hypothetical protein